VLLVNPRLRTYFYLTLIETSLYQVVDYNRTPAARAGAKGIIRLRGKQALLFGRWLVYCSSGSNGNANLPEDRHIAIGLTLSCRHRDNPA
jgi:hypothetical protein